MTQFSKNPIREIPGYSGKIPDNSGYSRTKAQDIPGYSRTKAQDIPGFSQGPIREKPEKAGNIPENRFAPVNFYRINEIALRDFPGLLARWLPDGRERNGEWVALNPTRNDRSPGSFKINIKTGKWADFATGDKGGDVISLAAYLSGSSQRKAARRLADYLGISHA